MAARGSNILASYVLGLLLLPLRVHGTHDGGSECHSGFVKDESTGQCLCEVGEGLVSAEGTEICMPCAGGTYKETRGNFTCTLCKDRNWVTLHSGSILPSACVCDIGYYMKPNQANESECYACATLHAWGLNCTAPGLTIETLPLWPGYWRATSSSLDVHECPNPRACQGGTQTGGESCVSTQQGPLCLECAQGFYTDTAGALCILCEGGEEITVVVVFALFIAAVFCA